MIFRYFSGLCDFSKRSSPSTVSVVARLKFSRQDDDFGDDGDDDGDDGGDGGDGDFGSFGDDDDDDDTGSAVDDDDSGDTDDFSPSPDEYAAAQRSQLHMLTTHKAPRTRTTRTILPTMGLG